jgi:serine/threonine protein kinase
MSFRSASMTAFGSGLLQFGYSLGGIESGDKSRHSTSRETMSETISPDTVIGQYRVISKVGEGGMGEVYRARDTKLGRDVAIKVLPAAFSADAERLRRFEQEAQAAGALNHPNILVIFHIGTHDGAPYIVSELLEGVVLISLIATPFFLLEGIASGGAGHGSWYCQLK